MRIDGWKYYNSAALSRCAPHENPDISSIENGDIWKIDGGTPLLARWTTDFDCQNETNWWYVIKEAPYVYDDLSKSQRKHIRQGLKKCYVRQFDAKESVNDVYRVYLEAAQKYQNFSSPMSKERFEVEIKNQCENIDYWGCFLNETDTMIGYMVIKRNEGYVDLQTAKFSVYYLNQRVSDVMYHQVLDYYLNELEMEYINSGERSINHITHTQEYKISNFQYRKVYCKLHIEYNPKIKVFVKLIYPFRKILRVFDGIGFVHKINGVIKMEEVVREG